LDNLTEYTNGTTAATIYSSVPVDANTIGVACGKYFTGFPTYTPLVSSYI
jgi:hypothetical protein